MKHNAARYEIITRITIHLYSLLCLKCHHTYVYAEIYEEGNNTNKFHIALTKQDITAMIQTNVPYVDKTCFLNPGHIF